MAIPPHLVAAISIKSLPYPFPGFAVPNSRFNLSGFWKNLNIQKYIHLIDCVLRLVVTWSIM